MTTAADDPSPPDYTRLIDAETWDFIRATEAFYPPETASYSILRQREIYDAMCRAFHHGHPGGIAVRDAVIGGVACRIYEPASRAPDPATIVYFHGGGFVVGGLDSHDDVCAEICAGTGLPVVSADYRLAPEHRHPAHFDDALAVALAVAGAGDGAAPAPADLPRAIVLAGDSAGGNLAASVAHRLRGGDADLRGQILIYPGLGGDRSRGSYRTHAMAPMLTLADVEYYVSVRYADGVEPVQDVTATPLQDSDFTGLPPTIALAAACDPLADDAALYVARIRAAGGRAQFLREPGLVHGYLRARHSVARAGASFARIIAGIRTLAVRAPLPDDRP